MKPVLLSKTHYENLSKSCNANHIATRLTALLTFLLMITVQGVWGQVVITTATGGTNISADKAANATSPAYTLLGNITLAETGKKDFDNGTFILDAPSGWTFNNSGVSVTGGASATTINYTTSTRITITLSNLTNGASETFNIVGISVRATNGGSIPSTGNITYGGGSAAQTGSGLTSGTTNLGSLSQVVGVVNKLAFATQPGGVTYGAVISASPVIVTQDQFGSASTTGLNATVNVTVAIASGSGALTGTTSKNIGSSGGNGTVTFNDLKTTLIGAKTISASATGFNAATSNSFTITEANLTITANDVHKTYGQTLTGGSGSTAFTPAGLQNSETIGSVTIAYGTGAAASDAVGTYANQVTASAATGGTFNANNYNISYIKGTIFVDGLPIATGDFRTKASGNFSAFGPTGVWEYDQGGNDWVDATAAPTSTNNVTVLNNHTITQDANFTVGFGKSLTLNSGNSGNGWIAGPGSILTIAGTANFNGNNVIVRSNASGTGVIGQITGTLSNATNVTVERYFPVNATSPRNGRAWRLVSIPVSGSGSLRDFFMASRAGADLTGTNTEPANAGTPVVGHGYPSASAATTAGFDWIGVANQVSSLRRYVGNSSGGTFNSADVPSLSTTYSSAEQGYIVFARGPRNVQFTNGSTTPMGAATTLRATGTLKTGNVTVSIAPASSSTYTLVGNPYVSVIDLAAVYNANSAVIKNSFSVWDANLNGSFNQGGYRTVFYNGTKWTDNLGNDNARYIESGLAFFAQPQSSVVSPTNITIAEAHKVTGNAGFMPFDNIPLSTQGNLLVRLEMQNDDGSRGVVDGVSANFNDAYLEGLGDPLDIATMANVSNAPMWLNQSGSRLAVEARPWPTTQSTLNIGMGSLQAVNYFIHFTPDQLNTPGLSAYLKDNFLNTQTDIDLSTASEYSFTRTSNTSLDSNRFQIVFTNNITVLPITLSNAKAYEKQGGVQVEWNISNESGIKRYEVEKSTNGINFTKMATLNAAGLAAYNCYDASAAKGNNYYRVKTIASDGSSKYSQVLLVNIGSKGQPAITFYPNPIKNNNTLVMQFSNMPAARYTLTLFNMGGQQLVRMVIDHNGGNAARQVPLLQNLPAGIYKAVITGTDGLQMVNNLQVVK